MSDPMKIVWGLGGLLVAVPFYFYMTKVYKEKIVINIYISLLLQ
ncbi:putative amino acid permease domain protein [[Clostridium] sordellii ATCC 9714]|nr:putative amino acid permease domain protein [[Clostridium] sordellii ATCC 9714] [Paeniclostridium sordellii ATCC 9714]